MSAWRQIVTRIGPPVFTVAYVASLKYAVSLVPSNVAFVLRMTFAVPDDAPVGGMYCNYSKTTRSPTAAQASQRKAGPSCFIIRPPPPTTTVRPPSGGSSTPPPAGGPSSPDSPDDGDTGAPILLPDTAMSAHQAKAVRDFGRTGAPSLR